MKRAASLSRSSGRASIGPACRVGLGGGLVLIARVQSFRLVPKSICVASPSFLAMFHATVASVPSSAVAARFSPSRDRASKRGQRGEREAGFGRLPGASLSFSAAGRASGAEQVCAYGPVYSDGTPTRSGVRPSRSAQARNPAPGGFGGLQGPRQLPAAGCGRGQRLLAREREGVMPAAPIVVRDELQTGSWSSHCRIPEVAETSYAIVQKRRFPQSATGRAASRR